MVKKVSILIIAIGVISLLMGLTFIGIGASKYNFIVTSMQEEQITLGMEEESGNVIDTPAEAQEAGDTVREHRHGIAPTYGDLLGNERFDPEDPTQLTYAQALNLENYLYLAVASFGLVQIALGSGAFMVLMGIGLGSTGLVLLKSR